MRIFQVHQHDIQHSVMVAKYNYKQAIVNMWSSLGLKTMQIWHVGIGLSLTNRTMWAQNSQLFRHLS